MNHNIIEHMIRLYLNIKSRVYTTLLSRFFYEIGRGSTIVSPLRFGNLAEVQLGKNVVIHGNSWIQVLQGTFPDISPKLIIKDNAAIGMNATISAAKRIIIEEYVFTARNVYISDHSHNFYDIEKPISLQGIDKIAEVIIGAETWIGQNAVILPGVTIGKHCVIGANAVVTKSIPDYSVVVGAPAKIIKTYDKNNRKWVRNEE